MKRLLRRIPKPTAVGLMGTLLLLGIFASTTHPAEAGIYYTTAYASVTEAKVDETFTVAYKTKLVVDTAATGYLKGSFTYPTDLIQLKSVAAGDYPNATFSTSDGLITVSSPDKGSGKGYGGYFTIVTATYKVIAGGTATFSANNGTTNGVMIVNGTNHSVNAANVKAIGCSPGYTGTYPNCIAPTQPSQPANPAPSNPTTPTSPATSSNKPATNTGSTNKTTTPQQATTTATVPAETSGDSNVIVTESSHETTPTSVHVILQTSGSLHNVQVRYGTAKDDLSAVAEITQQDKAIEFEVHGLSPSTVYYLKLEAIDASNKSITYQTGYVTKGYPVKVRVTGSNVRLAGRTLSINNTAYTTDADGSISANLASGSYEVIDTGTESSFTIEVTASKLSDGSDPVAQEFTFKLAAAKSSSSRPLSIAITSITILAVTLTLLYYFRQQHARPMHTMGEGPWDVEPYVIPEKSAEFSYQAPLSAAPETVFQPNGTSEQTATAAHKKRRLPSLRHAHKTVYVANTTAKPSEASQVTGSGSESKNTTRAVAEDDDNTTADHPQIKGVRFRDTEQTKSDTDIGQI